MSALIKYFSCGGCVGLSKRVVTLYLSAGSYEELKRVHQRLIRETERLEGRLKRRGVYEELIALAENVGFRPDRMDEAIAEILNRWRGKKEDAHTFVTLLEVTRNKIKIE